MVSVAVSRRVAVVFAVASVAAIVAWRGVAIGAEPQAKQHQVTLEKRADNGAYKKSAYSFRQATQNASDHKNYVDVLFNGCGLLHVNMYTSEASRICDLGEMKLADAPKAPPATVKWNKESITPEVGHVYFEEIADDDQKMTVEFRIDEATPDTVKLTWVTISPLAGPPLGANHGAAGTHGQCGHHAPE